MQKLRNVRKEIKDKKDIRHLYNEISYKHASQILQFFIIVAALLTKLRNFNEFYVILYFKCHSKDSDIKYKACDIMQKIT